MRFYTPQHQYYSGIDLYARLMYVCILNQVGDIVIHKNIQANPDIFPCALEVHDHIVRIFFIFSLDP